MRHVRLRKQVNVELHFIHKIVQYFFEKISSNPITCYIYIFSLPFNRLFNQHFFRILEKDFLDYSGEKKEKFFPPLENIGCRWYRTKIVGERLLSLSQRFGNGIIIAVILLLSCITTSCAFMSWLHNASDVTMRSWRNEMLAQHAYNCLVFVKILTGGEKERQSRTE